MPTAPTLALRLTGEADNGRGPRVGGEQTVLIATLGTEPQVVTLALQALAAKGERIDEVCVIHTTPGDRRIQAALERLDQAFGEDGRLARWRDRYRREDIHHEGGPVADMLSEADFGATLRVLYGVVRDYKQAGYGVHVNLAGGRKLMSIAAITAAQLLFDDRDRLWYLQSGAGLVESRELFAADAAEVILVPVPLLRWSPAPPVMTDLALADDPVAALTLQRERLSRTRQRFWQQGLSPAERQVAALLIRTGATDVELAQRLQKSHRTVSHQLNSIYGKLRDFLDVRDDVRVDRHTLITVFADMVPRMYE